MTSNPGTVSLMVGTSGSNSDRLLLVIAMARSRPALRCGNVGTMLMAVIPTSAPITAFNAGPPPL